MKDWAFINIIRNNYYKHGKVMDGRVCILLSVLIHLPFPQAKNSGEVRQVSRPKTPTNKDISQWRKGTTRILKYSLESLLQKKRTEQSEKGSQLLNILKFRHQKRSSLQYTELHPGWKGMNLKLFMYSIFSFCSFVCCLIWPGASSPCIHPDHHVDLPLHDQEGEGWKD